MGWPTQLNNQLKEAARLESDMLKYLFKDVIEFLGVSITKYMDESFGRDTMLKAFRLINTACPFLLLNDYRVSKQNSSLQRVEVLDRMLKEL